MKYYKRSLLCVVAAMVLVAVDVFACHKRGHTGNCKGICTTTDCAGDLRVLARTGNVPSQKEAIYAPYEKETGVKVRVETHPSQVGALVEKVWKAGKMHWDVVDATLGEALYLCKREMSVKIDVNLTLPKGTSGVRVSDDFGGLIGSECFVPHSVYSPVLVYREDLRDDQPAQLCSIFDGSNHRRTVRPTPSGNLELALLCDGVAAKDVYSTLATKAGQDQAINLFTKVAKKIEWLKKTEEVVRALEMSSVTMGLRSSSGLMRKDHGSGLRVLAGPRVLRIRGWAIPNGLSAKRRARALDFVSFATDPSRLANSAQLTGAWPARKTALELLPKDIRDNFGELSVGHKDVVYDGEFWLKHGANINNRFRKQLGIRQ